MIYKGKDLKEFNLWDLELAMKELLDAEARREEASKHHKFHIDTEVNKVKIPKMEFPPPNPEFLKLKDAINQEIESRKNA